MTTVYLPFTGELGSSLLRWIPTVLAAPEPKIICHAPGDEALFPNVARHLVPRPSAELSGGAGSKDDAERWQTIKATLGPDMTYVEPAALDLATPLPPTRPTGSSLNLSPDVVLLPRDKWYAANRNWSNWNVIASRLKAAGLDLFVAGLPETTFDLGTPAAWDYDRPLDATLAALAGARLVVGPPTGTALLALMVGAPLWVVCTADGRCAPNGLSVPHGYFVLADLDGIGYRLAPYWDAPERLAEEIVRAIPETCFHEASDA